ncbi:MAG: CFI-box-CTERM domain-containing protein, partial [Planctomycetota bacterium]
DFFNKATDVVKVVEVTSASSDEARVVVSRGCFLLRLYGEGSDEIEILREFRNHFMNKSLEGQAIINFYYKWSPLVVKAIEEDEEIKEQLKEVVDNVLLLIKEKVQ